MKVSEPPSAPRRPSDGTWGRCHRGGRVMGRGAPRCPPPHFAIPPPQEQHFLGYVNARSRAPFRPRRPRGVGEMEGGGRGGIRSPCRTGSRAPSTLQREQWLRVTLTPHRRPHGTCQPHRAVGPQPARGHGANPHPDRGTEGPQAVPSPLHAGGFGVDGGWGGGGGVLGSAAPTLGCSRLLLHSRGTSQPQWGE